MPWFSLALANEPLEHMDSGREANKKLTEGDRCGCGVNFFDEVTARRVMPRRMATAVGPESAMVLVSVVVVGIGSI